MKSAYFALCILLSQMAIKYLYYLNKSFKSTQFALEATLKYDYIETNYKYNNEFDLVDSENLKKNQ